jgi:hypothetical protein
MMPIFGDWELSDVCDSCSVERTCSIASGSRIPEAHCKGRITAKCHEEGPSTVAAFGLSHQCRKEEAPENVARWIRPQQEAARCPCSGRSREDKGEGVDGAGQEARVAAADRRWGGTGSAYRAAWQGGDEGKADRGAGGPQIGLDRLLAETDRGVVSSP